MDRSVRADNVGRGGFAIGRELNKKEENEGQFVGLREEELDE